MKREINLPTVALTAVMLVLPLSVSAHCPLCTAGVGLAALAAYKIGVSGLTVGLLIGAFAIALGLWLAKIIKKKVLPAQNQIVAITSWLITVLPLQSILAEYTSIYISSIGQYGSWYPINLFLVGSFLGAILVYLADPLSLWLTSVRGKKFPFQTMIITITLVIIASLLTQFIF